jgi:transcriptional regulator with XRE-family HTH domain
LELSKAFGLTLRRLRKQAGLTQEKLAFETDLERNYISLLELGQRLPSLHTCFKIATALRMPPAELIKVVSEQMAVTYSDN